MILFFNNILYMMTSII